MDFLQGPGGLAVAAALVAALLVLWWRQRSAAAAASGPDARIGALVKRGKLGEAARVALDAGELATALDLYLRAQQPASAAAVAAQRGDLAQAAELYERAADWERAVALHDQSGNPRRAEELRRTKLAPAAAGAGAAKADAAPSATRGQELELAVRRGLAVADLGDGTRAELQRDARAAADALLAEGDLARAAQLLADSGLDDEAIHLWVNVLGEPGRGAPLVARRGNHQRAAELYELAGEHEQAAREWEAAGDASRARALAGEPRAIAVASPSLSPSPSPEPLLRRRPREAIELPPEIVADTPAPRARLAFDPELSSDQLQRLAAQVADAAVSQLRRRVELPALPPLPAVRTPAVRTEVRAIGLEQAPLEQSLLADPAVIAARGGPGLVLLRHFTGGRPCDLGNIEVYYRIGLHHQAHGNFDDALLAYDAVEDASPGYRDAWRRAELLRAWKAALASATRLAVTDDAPGGERYELRGELGRGGMAVVYRAFDRRLDRDVALKFLSEEVSREPAVRELFEREARAVAGLNHPNIVTVHDTGVLAGRAFICMELVDGPSVESLMREPEGLPIVESLRIGKQVLDALAYAHERGIVHRDVKPANIMRTASGLVKLMDFGLARTSARGGAASIVAGTPAYMAPEQLAGGELDHRADLFAASVTLYEMLSGALPFAGVDRQTPPAPLAERVPAVPEPLEEAIMRGLAFDRAQRPQHAAELAERIAATLDAVNAYVRSRSSSPALPLPS